MGKYAKLFGSILGSVVGLGISGGMIDQSWGNPEVIGSVATILGAAFGTYIAPKNRED